MADIEVVRSTLKCGGVFEKAGCSALCAPTPPTASPVFLTSPSGEPTNSQVKEQLGIFDVFKVGIGPSSSHTVGPMAAAYRFLTELHDRQLFEKTVGVCCDLFGSLALTGAGHGTDKAICVGLTGNQPATVDPDEADKIFDRAKVENKILLGGKRDIVFVPEKHMIFHFDAEMPHHPNGMRLGAFDDRGSEIYFNEFLSIGGGFIKTVAEFGGTGTISAGSPTSTRANSVDANSPHFVDDASGSSSPSAASTPPHPKSPPPAGVSAVPYPFKSASDLIRVCRANDLSIAQVMFENERVKTCNGDMSEVYRRVDHIWQVIWECIERGKKKEGIMPVSGMKRQAPMIYKRLKKDYQRSLADHFAIMDWVTLFARCVNEENACGGRIVTAPTNGAAGTLPAVLAYYAKFFDRATDEGIREFLATAAAFGALIKTNASISGAEAGCQAEVGSACAMAAAGLTAAMGGTLEQIENAAEIGLEHNLGMTCDPLSGLVQVPCIERNCVAAIKAITAHRLAIKGDGWHEVSFDSCVQTMYRTGLDMQSKYRETSTGGLALYARRPDHFEKGVEIRRRRLSSVGNMSTDSLS